VTPLRSARSEPPEQDLDDPPAGRFADGRFRGATRRPRTSGTEGPRTGQKRTVMHAIRQIPHYLRLLAGLMTDRRVALVDKAFVAAAIAYIVMPLDLIPDFIPFLGEVDDLFLLFTALQRLVGNAGRATLLTHWRGDPEELADLNLGRIVSAASFFLPLGMRRRLRRIAGG
jgi:uncharacterized membrane protein YkvA (DUF1232 family)